MAIERGQPVPLAVFKARLNIAVHDDRPSDAAGWLDRLLAESSQCGDRRYHADNLVVAALGFAQCELGAAIYGLGLGVLVGCVVYVVAGVMTIRHHRREGDRLTPSLIHAALPIGLVILAQLASFASSFIS